MNYVQVHIGVETADAENVALQFEGCELVLTYVDWQERPQRKIFADVMAFRWQAIDDPVPRDDVVYEVRNSDWLAWQCELNGTSTDGRAHYKLCFNSWNSTLDVICQQDRGTE